ncbi:BREX-1 system adenine-specific DNA-methyltransferase PglX [Vibrio parahaemolyticus]|uniref:BREX-1 system adenine-specific DNA-methyltransferase PglX n=1 Tax=Vibrio parahaemolyticus TaxID=670 RepID=UPI002AC336D4|nr:BREX-1 system adenine-specific DNA-methyltransferase PglX [Vibrio parahaemolyticus]
MGFIQKKLDETLSNGKKWYPYNKGGEFRKWYGNFDSVINWESDGQQIKEYAIQRNGGKHWSRYIQNLDYMLKEGITWTFISSSYFGARFTPQGHLFDYAGCSAFPKNNQKHQTYTGYFCSGVAQYILRFLNPTLNLQPGNISTLPNPNLSIEQNEEVSGYVDQLIEIAKIDWDEYERSWNFKKLPLVMKCAMKISTSYNEYVQRNLDIFHQAKHLEQRNKKVFIEVLGLSDELSNELNDDEISLMSNLSYRYKNDRKTENLSERYRSDTLVELCSYSVGCIMGRYSLDREGLVYAHSGNQGFKELIAEGAYKTFPADDDGIIPLAAEEWLFEDDATSRFRDFVKTVWGEEHLQENLDFVAESLCLDAIKPKKNERTMDTIRRYFSSQFYKDHLKTYKKRPIYWLFSSGKEKAFECLVYLHRYNESTLARMRTEYVTPLMGRMESQYSVLEESRANASGAEQRRIDKELKSIEKKQSELRAFDEELKHLAEMKISIDLDDGVKVNYGKFGNLLADVKAIHGKKPEVIK